jgi:uncharacterized protein YkwD
VSHEVSLRRAQRRARASRVRTAVAQVTGAAVFGLSMAAVVAVLVAGPETREAWRQAPAQMIEAGIATVTGDTSPDSAEQSREDRAANAASRSSRTVRSSAPAAAPLPEPTVEPSAEPVEEPAPEPTPEPEPEPAPEEPADPAEPAPDAPAPDAPAPDTTVAAPPVAEDVAQSPAPVSPAPVASAGMNAESAAVLEILNAERAAAGCQALRADQALVRAAQLHSEDMAANDYMSHTSLDGRGPGERAAAQGYTSWSGENVAKGQRTAEEVMTAWMNSPGHKANIVSCSSVAVGIGYSGGAWTQLFGYV